MGTNKLAPILKGVGRSSEKTTRLNGALPTDKYAPPLQGDNMKKFINSFLEFHNYIVEDCKTSKIAFINWYIFKPTALVLAIAVWITLLVR